MTEWLSIPDSLRQFDTMPDARCDEQVIVQILWSCLEGLPSLPSLLKLPQGARVWNKGARGCGDLIGRPYEGGVAVAHVEIKSGQARISEGKDCPHKCGIYQSQFEHMAHDKHATIQVFTHTARMPRLTNDLVALGLGVWVQVRSFKELADAVKQAFKQDGAPQYDLVWSLLDGRLP